MIEVVLAIGVLGFCLLALIGLLPTGLGSQRAAQEQARASSAIDMVASAVESLRYTTRSAGNVTWAFPSYFSDNSGPFLVWTTQPPWSYTFFVSDGGLIIPAADTTTAKRQSLYVKVYPPASDGKPVQIYVAVAWPYKGSDTNATTPADMKGRAGYLDSIVAYTPKASP